ncbi:MAG: NIPSNAP family protein [Vicinamibacteria bacterium]
MEIADGRHDFDFWMGTWRIHNRRLRARLSGSTEWDEFEARGQTWPMLNGLGNRDEFRTGFWPDFLGMTFRFFDPATRTWSIYWADSRHGTLEPPVVGRFEGDVGTFYGEDVFEGRPIRVRFIWTRGETPRWEQAFSTDGGGTWETNWTMDMTREDRPARERYGVVELRRYAIVPGGLDRFARSFDGYFPEAFQALGAIAFGQFAERGRADRFTWLRGTPDYDAHAAVKSAVYDGPIWKELAPRVNPLIADSDDVLFLRPLRPERGVVVLPPVDVLTETEGPRGIAVARIFGVAEGAADAFAERAETAFARYAEAGAREAGVLVSLDRPNNFPRHPIRTDGPFVVWLGVVPDEPALEKLHAAIDATAPALQSTGLLRGDAETVALDPTPRSRLRWRTER